MIELEINGKKVTSLEGAMIIEAADAAGIYIPRFCYHKKLTIAANCRMCLVEVEKVGKPVPACATPVTQDMKVFTQSQKALDAQRMVMEFLLINHPLDCPICDQGGQCELQDLSMGYGRAYSMYNQAKRSVASENIGPLIETWMTRCIQCTRCVRFGEEIAGLRELGVLDRGEKEEIGTYVKHFLKSELSGNITDICPVGALTEKPSRYNERAWEVREHASIAPHDCVGSNIYVHSFFQEYSPARKVMKVVPRENESINEVWISDRDRFSYEGLRHSDRFYKPLMSKNGQWIEVDWERAILEIADRTRGIVQQQGAHELAAIVSPNSTIEELYLMQKMMRALGSSNIDHRYREHDFSDQDSMPVFPNLGVSIATIPQLKTILMVGSNVRHEQPMLCHRINMAKQEGASVYAVNPMDYEFTFDLNGKVITADVLTSLAGIVKALSSHVAKEVDGLSDIQPSAMEKHIASELFKNENAAIFIGEFAMHHPQAAEIRAYVRLIGLLSGAKFGYLTDGANAAGAWLAGAVPHRRPAGKRIDKPGLDAKSLFKDKPVRAYYLLNVEPESDTAYSERALKALKQAGLVVYFSPFVSDRMREVADFVLPIAPFTETAGTFVNAEGVWQHFAEVTHTEEVKPAWKVLRVLANFLELDGFDFKTVHEVSEELKHLVNAMPEQSIQEPVIDPGKLQSDNKVLRYAPWPMYRVDSLVRRAASLQACIADDVNRLSMNASTAKNLNVSDGDSVRAKQQEHCIDVLISIDDRIADDLIVLPAGTDVAQAFGENMAPMTISKGAV